MTTITADEKIDSPEASAASAVVGPCAHDALNYHGTAPWTADDEAEAADVDAGRSVDESTRVIAFR